MDSKSSTSKQTPEEVQEPKKGCYSCKVISVACLLSIGGYLFYHGRAQSSSQSKIVFYTLAIASTGLGIGEIFDKSPFRSYD